MMSGCIEAERSKVKKAIMSMGLAGVSHILTGTIGNCDESLLNPIYERTCKKREDYQVEVLHLLIKLKSLGNGVM